MIPPSRLFLPRLTSLLSVLTFTQAPAPVLGRLLESVPALAMINPSGLAVLGEERGCDLLCAERSGTDTEQLRQGSKLITSLTYTVVRKV